MVVDVNSKSSQRTIAINNQKCIKKIVFFFNFKRNLFVYARNNCIKLQLTQYNYIAYLT